MILGLGTDLVSIPRLHAALTRGNGFREHSFTPAEIAAAAERADGSTRLAGRWAAKEALSKALGTGCGADCRWQEIEVINADNGRPEMTLCGTTLATFKRLGANKIHLSISHDGDFACATVIIERIELEDGR